MSTYESPADLELQRDLAISDHESRTHEVQYKKHKRAFLDDWLQPICPLCGALADPMDREDARTLGRRHTADMAADDVAAGVDHG